MLKSNLVRIALTNASRIAWNRNCHVANKARLKSIPTYCLENIPTRTTTSIASPTSPSDVKKIIFQFNNGFFKFSLLESQYIISYWTPLKTVLQAIDTQSPTPVISQTQVIDETNKVVLSPATPIGFIFCNMQNFSFEHPTLGLCQVEYSGSPGDLVHWKEKFEVEMQYAADGYKKPETMQDQEIKFLEHEKDSLRATLTPELQKYRQIVALARTDAVRKFKWGGLFLLSAQMGFVARLTWFEYSWDIMEPITWMLTYAMMVGTFAYYIVTSQEYLVPSVERRLTISKFWKLAQKEDFDVVKFRALREQIKLLDNKIMKLKTGIPF